MTQPELDNLSPELVYRVAQLFIFERERLGNFNLATVVAEAIRTEFSPLPKKFTHLMVYPIVAEAAKRGFVTLVPPFDLSLRQKFSEAYPHLRDRVHIVKTTSPEDSQKVADAAASIALGIAKKIQSRTNRAPIGLGLGPGRATRDFCKAFAKLLQSEPTPIHLKLHAISAGCPAKSPEYASISFFNSFDDRFVKDRTGLFAETLVPVKDLKKIASSPKRVGDLEGFLKD